MRKVEEQWLPHPESPSYKISSFGRIIGARGELLSPGTSGDGRRHLSVRVNGRSKLVHVLVLETFVSARPTGQVARHLDGNGHNNFIENLRWGTQVENLQEAVRDGFQTVSLNPTIVRIILHLRNMGKYIQQREMAKIFGVSESTISEVCKRRKWKFIPMPDGSIW